ncbi:MAG: hypothetical protein COA71_07170 [SAR86 cluster bacterium]|uniref:VOC domain-containing protein n=1 Tax=SAR86 cluster bacterium TaxID=2030880 RepID=A0A2A5CE52_9GAMM|nr:VOC family protein [Gammaproteobacteria bacterium AH-315-E17]PCJ41785.1 MAG: hypothetical protein COA71_07170 [SAR86 cluster bacterium]
MKSKSFLHLAFAACIGMIIYPVTLLAHDGPHSQSVSIPHLMVEDLDASLAFYIDVLGFELTRPLGEPMPNQMAGDGEGRMRVMVMQEPQTGIQIELVEWSNIPMRAQQLQIQDAGAFMIALQVSDLDSMLDGARELGLEIQTEDGDYIVRSGGDKYVMIRDADGYTVELVENTESRDQAGISSVSYYLTVEDLDETVEFYNQAFGMGMEAPGSPNPTPEFIISLFDNDQLSNMRIARGTFPNTDFVLSFQEFSGSGLTRRKADGGVEDPGEALLLISVDNFTLALANMRRYGGIVGLGATSEAVPEGVNYSWGHDPNGMLLRISPPRNAE